MRLFSDADKSRLRDSLFVIGAALAVALLLLASEAMSAEVGTVYVSSQPGQLPLYTDRPGSPSSEIVFVSSAPATPRIGTRPHDRLMSRRKPLEPLIERAARAHGLDAALLFALVEVESRFDADAVSPKGAIGLAQVMPATAARYGSFDLFAPAQNVHVGARYLRDLLTLFDGDRRLALAAYNAGENAVIRYGRRVPPYPETQRYVVSVLARYGEYLRHLRVRQSTAPPLSPDVVIEACSERAAQRLCW